MSSLTAHEDISYDPTDWQLVDSSQPYEGSKFQIDLISAELSRRAGPSSPVRHFTVHPGVVFSSIDAALVGSFTSQIKFILCVIPIPPFLSSPFFHQCFEFPFAGARPFRRPGGLALCTTTSRPGMVPLSRPTSASPLLHSFLSFCLLWEHRPRRTRGSRKKVCFRRVCIR